MGVKAVLEERSPKYQQLMAFQPKTVRQSTATQTQYKPNAKTKSAIQEKLISAESEKAKISKPIVIPHSVNKTEVKRLIKENPQKVNEIEEIEEPLEETIIEPTTEQGADTNNIIEEPPKRGRGRPRKTPPVEVDPNKPKRGRGRPPKNPVIQEEPKQKEVQQNDDEDDELIDLFNLDDEPKQVNNQQEEEPIDLFGLGDDDEEENDEPIDLFNLDENEDEQEYENKQEELIQTAYKPTNTEFNSLITKDKKVVAFVGTTKNGTSFVVNNVAEMLASTGISTAVLDMSKNKNAYYVYTNNEQRLMTAAKNSIYKLRSGVAEGVRVNKNLSIFTSLPEEDNDYSDAETILGTLVKNFSAVLIDCDFDTPVEYFEKAQEIYLVQSMDVLTMQPLTAFLRNLQSKNVLRQEKLKIVINKSVKIKSVSVKRLIGGIANYNDPSMTIMKELFNPERVPYCEIPFEVPNYIKYLDSMINCSISLNGYTKNLMMALKELAGMVYPLINRQTYSPRGNQYKDNFSSDVNSTLNKMKNKYQQ